MDGDPVRLLRRAGPNTAKRLATLDITTAGQLAHAEVEVLTSTFRPRTGLWLLLLANGGGDDVVSALRSQIVRLDRRCVCAGVSPYRAVCAVANRPRFVKPQRLAIEATVSTEGSDTRSS